ncbi:MAG: PstS family phosphate ABC transporter substrate-binding protein [Anaerolineae bacterium]
MKNYSRRLMLATTLGVALLSAAAFNLPLYAQAQSPEQIKLDGSAIVASVINVAKANYASIAPQTDLQVTVSGTATGIEALCAGSTDIAMAYGAIGDTQAAQCASNNINFVELLLGYDATVIVVHNGSAASCVTVDQLNSLLAPGAADVKDWNATDSNLATSPITAFYRLPDNPERPPLFLLDRLINGEGLRADLQVVGTSPELAQKINDEIQAVGILPLADFNANVSGKSIRALEIKDGTACIAANAINLDEGRYPLAEPLYLYVNSTALNRAAVSAFLTYLITTGKSAVSQAQYVTASDVIYARGESYISEKRTGRTFSRLQSVKVAADTAGVISIDGSPRLAGLFNDLNATFTPRYNAITFTVKPLGDANGYSALCNNRADVIGVTREPTAEESAACQTANIQTLRVPLGLQAAVVVVNGENPPARCLSLENLSRVFEAKFSAKKWSEVAQGLPETDLLVLTPTAGDLTLDHFMSSISTQIAPIVRYDVVENADPLYRGTAVQNVVGGITLMRYDEFQKLTAKVQALHIDAGNGCVAPTEANIRAGKYPLTTSYALVINLNTFSRPEMRAYSWYLASDDALTVLNQQGYIGTDANAFPGLRELLLERITAAEQAANATPTPEATSEATVEATSEATAAPPAEGTASPTAEPTPESTPEATPTGTGN